MSAEDAAADEAALTAAIDRASEAEGLATWYRSCVRPLLRMPQSQWPRCCGATCEPCNDLLKRVAARVLRESK